MTLSILAICLLALFSAGACAQSAPAAGEDYRAVLTKANEQFLKIKSYHMSMELTGYISFEGKEASFVGGGEADAQLKPMLMKNVISVAVEAAGSGNEFTFTQYTEEAGDKITLYSQAGGKWSRTVMPNPTPATIAKRDEAMRKSLELFSKAIGSVTLVRETDDSLFLDVALNLGSLLEGMGEIMPPADGKKPVIPPDIVESLKELKDLVYTVEIDKKTLLYSSVSFDLSAFVGSIGEKLIEVAKVPPEKQAAIRETLNSLQIKGSIAFSRYNAIVPIIIPPEAKNAPLLAPKPPVKPDAAPPTKQPTPGASGEASIKIGADIEMTGAQAVFGHDVLEGARLAVKEINEAGGVLGRRLELVVRDNASSPPESARAAAALISQDRVVAIVGAVTSFDTMAAASYADSGRVPMISPTATNPKVTVEGGQVRKYLFRAAFIDPYQGQVMSRFAIDSLHARTAALIIDETSDYSKGLAHVFQSNFRNFGGTIVARETYLQKDTGFGAQLQRVRDANPDVIFVPGYYQEVGLVVRQAREMGIAVPILGGDGWDSPRIVQYSGPDALNDTYFCNHFAVQDQAPLTKKFVAAYSREYGKLPNAIPALGYDSLHILAAAVKKAGDADPEKICDAIEKTQLEGVTGRISFDASHNPVKSAVVMKFIDGRQTFFQRMNP
jgi:branched-chain amino acid transport system substrate-binding protein